MSMAGAGASTCPSSASISKPGDATLPAAITISHSAVQPHDVAGSEPGQCFAAQDKVWMTGPAGEKWEVYTVLAAPTRSAPALRIPVTARTPCAADRLRMQRKRQRPAASR